MSAKRTRISPRIRLREDDGLKTTRPKSTSDGRAIGSIDPFSDNSTLVFEQGTVVYPVMLPSGSALIDITGIAATGRATPGASDVHAAAETSKIAPFKESFSIASSSFYLDPVQGLFGPLGSRTAIKIDISSAENKYVYRCSQRLIDRSPGGEFSTAGTGFCYFNTVTRRWDDIGKYDPATGAKLITEQATSFTSSNVPVSDAYLSGTSQYMGQFVPPNHINSRGIYETGASAVSMMTFEDHVAMGVQKIGTPTATFFAPSATKYHATSSNVIKMSDYISQPFLLEKIRIDLPSIAARRTHGYSPYEPPSSLIAYPTASNDLQCRDMDNYVFFLYRQSRRSEGSFLGYRFEKRDTPQEASSSVRFLIASSSLCFYNSPTHRAGAFGLGPVGSQFVGVNSDSFPFHSPAFKHDFNMAVTNPTASAVPTQSSHYSGSISIQMTPGISPAGLAGALFLPISTASAGAASYYGLGTPTNGYSAHCYFQHAWPGTAGAIAMGDKNVPGSFDYSGKVSAEGYFITKPVVFKTIYNSSTVCGFAYTNYLNVEEYFFRPAVTPYSFPTYEEKEITSIARPDPRSFFTSFGPGILSINIAEKNAFSSGILLGASSVNNESGRGTPVVLLPTDELVLGIDAGIAPFMRDSSTITGSYLRIDAGEATLTLYGSQIVNNNRRVNMSSVSANSEAAHLVDAENLPLDEFLLETPGSSYGNYFAPLATGSFPNRGVQALGTLPTLFPQFPGALKWYPYPRIVTLVSDLSDPIDAGQNQRYIFRADKFGQPANMLSQPSVYAVNKTRAVQLPGFKTAGRANSFYPVTNIFTGSASFSGNTSLHATSSRPFSDK